MTSSLLRRVALASLVGAPAAAADKVVAAAASAVDAPITAVTVYSDRARVTRTASVTLGGKQSIELPLLGDRIDSASIKLESADADVQKIEIVWVAGEEGFPKDEAREVLAALEALDSEIARGSRDRQAYAMVMGVASGLAPAVPGIDAPRAAPRLSAAAWGSVFGFVRGFADKTQGKLRELDERLEDMARKRTDLVDKARRIGAERRRGGWRVTAVVSGKGKAELRLSYMVTGARWYPSYDIELDAAAQKVDVAFAGLVSQETGEDWDDAMLTVSTAVPASAIGFPKMTTWKIGEKERFVPKPAPHVEPPLPPPPPVPALPRAAADRDEIQDLRQALARQVEAGARLQDRGVAIRELERSVDALKAQANENRRRARGEASMGPAPAAPPPPPEASFDGDEVSGEVQEIAENAPTVDVTSTAGSPRPAMAPPAAMPSRGYARKAKMEVASASAGSYDAEEESVSSTRSGSFTPTVSFGIAPPPGYVPPYIAPDLPAKLAGGYDLTYRAAAPDTVKSGKGARRVALFRRSFPVAVERRVFPDLATEAAFLVAELKNPTGQPLPGGQAKLFVGADPAGVARLETVAAGETFTLPLGLDRGIKPIRNVKVVTSESGLIKKDETSEYTVTIEIANPTRAPMAVRVVDQLPVTDDKDLEVKLVRAAPATSPVSEQDKAKGKLEWRLEIPAAGKSTVTFVYTLKRPKGYRLHQ